MNIQKGTGKRITLTATAAVTSGVPVKIGAKLFGVPEASASIGKTFALVRQIELTYTAEGAGSGQAWAIGDDIYWDDTAKRFTKTSTSNLLVGIATAVKVTTDVSGTLVLI